MSKQGTLRIAGIFALIFGLLASFKLLNQHQVGVDQIENVSPSPGFALVELFTSQGCSSCPPADEYLSKLIESGEKSGKQIIALSFHVSYWNRLGWTDPFSQEEFTHRQQRYSQAFGSSTIYTPQMIVNGNQAYSSSRPGVINQGVTKVLSQTPNLRLTTAITSVESKQVRFKVTTKNEDQFDTMYLHAALVEKGLSTAIKRGENVGRTLHHDNVVRKFTTWEFKKSIGKELAIQLPDDINVVNTSLVVFAQKPSTMEVLGADQLGLNNIK